MPTWDSDQYLRFEEYRTRPARDLLARVPVGNAETVIDVGCGPANSTRLLLDRWPGAAVTGIDSSAPMLEKARQSVPEGDFVHADLREWRPEQPADVVFSNATIQWLEDHAAVLSHLLSWVAPGGVLAVQMPRNYDQPSHVRMRDLAESGRWGERLTDVLRVDPVGPVEDYHRMVTGPDRRVEAWTTEYLHVLQGADPVVEWMRGSGLRPVLDRLNEGEAEEFVAAYATAMRDSYPPEPDGTTLFPFRRVFLLVSG